MQAIFFQQFEVSYSAARDISEEARHDHWKQPYIVLKYNLLYKGITRSKKLIIRVGQKYSLAMAVRDM